MCSFRLGNRDHIVRSYLKHVQVVGEGKPIDWESEVKQIIIQWYYKPGGLQKGAHDRKTAWTKHFCHTVLKERLASSKGSSDSQIHLSAKTRRVGKDFLKKL